MSNFLEEDFSRLTARDLLLRQNDKQKVLEDKLIRQERDFEQFKNGEFKEMANEVKSLSRFRSENVGIWKTVTGISIILGILATLIALIK